jgi:hypothetical protein
MRNLLILVALMFSPVSKISQLPDGIMSDNVYSNTALGLRFEIPTGWIATADPRGPVTLDDRHPDGPVNQCSRILLSLHDEEKAKGQFNSTATLFAVDPACFPNAKFPKSLKDKKGIQEFARKIVNSFSHTPYISRNGADIDADTKSGLLFILLTGEDSINAVEEGDHATTQPLHVNKLLFFTKSNRYWVVWAVQADDATKAELAKRNGLQFKVP